MINRVFVRTVFVLLAFIFILTPIQAQQPPTVQSLDLPQDYEMWESTGPVRTLTIRRDLVAEQRGWKKVSGDYTEVIIINMINSEIVHAWYLGGSDHEDDPEPHMIMYWLTKTGFTKLDNRNGFTPELELNIAKTWESWDKFLRDRYKISDEEMAELGVFLLL